MEIHRKIRFLVVGTVLSENISKNTLIIDIINELYQFN